MKRIFRKPSKRIEVTQVFRRLGQVIEKRHLIFLILSLVLLVPTIIAATQVEMKTGFDTFVSSDAQAYKDLEKYNEYFSSDAIVVLITGDNLIQLLEPENIAAMDFIEESMISDNSSHSVVGPVFLLEMAHLQRVLSGATTSMEFPTDPAELAEIIKDPETGDVASELTHVFPDSQHALISILLDGSLTQDEQGDMVRKVEDLAASAGFNDDVSVIVSGNCAVYASIGDLMVEDMLNMLIVSVILMLLILALIFNVRGFFAWRWLPLGVVALAIIYTFGIMGILSIPLTMVTMAAFPILLGLGVDYAIQFHNRYDEESKKGKTVAGALAESVTHIGPAIGIAIVAGCLGFAALFFSPIPMIQGFGFTLILGVIICYILSVFLLLSALYRRDRMADTTKAGNGRQLKWTIKPKNKFTLGPELAAAVLTLSLVGLGIVFIACEASFDNLGFAVGIGITVMGIIASTISLGIELHRERLGIALPKKGKEKPRHIVDSGLDRLAPWVVKHPLVIIPVALALTVAGLVADPYIETEADEMNMISQETKVVKDLREVESVVEGLEFLSLLIEAEDVTDPQIVNWVLELQDCIEAENGDLVSGTESYASAMMQLVNVMNLSVPQTAEETKDTLQGLPTQLRANLLTEDYTRSNLMVTIGKISGPQVRDLETALNEYASQHPEGVTVTVTGWPIMMRILGDGLSGGRVEMTLVGIALIFVGLLLLFRFNILKVFMAILPVALIIGWSSGVMWLGDIKYTPATAAMGALIIGIGTEFTILLMMRYYEERGKGENPVEAMKTAITRIGRAIIASGLTVIGGFAALLIAQNFPVLRSFGLITVIDVFFALVSTLIVLPALIVWIDSWRDRRRLARQGSS